MGILWNVDKWSMDKLVGRKGMSRLNVDGLDIGRLGFEGTLDFMDSLLCDHYGNSDIYHNNDGEWWWDEHHNRDVVWS